MPGPSFGVLIAAALAMALAGYLAGSRHRDDMTIAVRNVEQAHATLQQLNEDLARQKESVLQVQNDLIKRQSEEWALREELRKLEEAEAEEFQAANVKAQGVPEPLRSYLPCRPPSRLPVADLPIYFVVIGVEGAGHHAMEAVWHDLSKFYDFELVTYNPGLHSFAKHPNVSRAYQFPSAELQKHRNQFTNFLRKPTVAGKKLIIDSRNSYPMGFGVGSLGHPDLTYLAQLDGELFDLRVLIVYRDPTACVLSSVRRFKVKEFQYKNFQYQARSVQESLTVINNGISQLTCGKFHVMRYESFIENPNSQAAPLSQLLSVNEGLLRKCFKQLHAPKPKASSDEVNAMKEHLKRFFHIQEHLWPILTGARDVPRLHIEREPLHPISTGSKKDASANAPAPPPPQIDSRNGAKNQGKPASSSKGLQPATRDKYLRIRWFKHLGFNNMRFIMEMALNLGALLQRKVMFPPTLRMRRCVDPVRCAIAPGCTEIEERDGPKYWCPLTAFVDEDALVRSGAVIVDSDNEFIRGKKQNHVKDAFGLIYSEETLWLERLPDNVKGHLRPDHTASHELASMLYWRYHLGCELSYFRIKPESWTSRSKAKQIYGFVDEYGEDESDVLFLDGTPHHIGLTPTFWSSEESLMQSSAIWEAGLVYNREIQRIAHTIKQQLTHTVSTTGSYVCVHLRRGDFVDAKWLGDAEDLGFVANNIRKVLHADEPFYLATDEQDPTILADLRAMGGRQWTDFEHLFTEADFPDSFPYLGFEDYIGLVEQMVCGEARLFLGSKCSSFSGGIFNLRRKLVGDSRALTVVSKNLGGDE
eukprot:m.27738 g.27738  ORF g.27738 m.27738 type:complete len:814 (+) comp4819_c0_seq1:485-2926(+)